MSKIAQTTKITQHTIGNTIFHLKMECDQPSGSFKLRGMETFIKSKLRDGHTSFVSSSGGNAGYSAAFVANKLGLKMTVVAPQKTPELARKIIRSIGAELIIEGQDWYEADLLAQQLVAELNACYVHPFDDPLLWQGHSRIVDELVTQINKPDAIVLSVGGGGLMLGIIEGLKRHAWTNVEIIACETEGAASFQASKSASRLIELDVINSVAVSLGARRIAQRAFDVIDEMNISCHIMTDKEAVRARDWFNKEYDREVEPACGAALDVITNPSFSKYNNVAVIVCGGIGWDSQLSSQFLSK